MQLLEKMETAVTRLRHEETGHFTYKMVDSLLQLLLCRFSIAQFFTKKERQQVWEKKAKACRLRDAILCDL